VPTDLQRLMKSESIQSVLRLRHDAPQRRRAYPLARVPGLGLAMAGRFSLTREPAVLRLPPHARLRCQRVKAESGGNAPDRRLTSLTLRRFRHAIVRPHRHLSERTAANS
jgi:hypothetical protein